MGGLGGSVRCVIAAIATGALIGISFLLLWDRIKQTERKIMSQITDAVTKLEADFAEVSNDITALASQIKALQDQIASGLSADDAAALAKVVADADALAAAAKAAVPPA
jgi:outer membrane murein-binding lipoprotein Lpp